MLISTSFTLLKGLILSEPGHFLEGTEHDKAVLKSFEDIQIRSIFSKFCEKMLKEMLLLTSLMLSEVSIFVKTWLFVRRHMVRYCKMTF